MNSEAIYRAAANRLSIFFSCLRDQNVAIISAHRARVGHGYPENSLIAIEYATELGPVIVEIDVLPSSDGVLFLHHDSILDRTTSGIGPIAHTESRRLSRLRLKDDSGNITQHPMNTFQEVLEWTEGKVLLQVDVKRPTSMQQVLREVRRAGADGRVFYIVYSLSDAKALTDIAPDAIVSIGITSSDDIGQAAAAGLRLENVHALVNDPEPNVPLYRQYADRGATVVFGTFRGPNSIDASSPDLRTERYREIASSDVGIIVSDDPKAVSDALLGDPTYVRKLGECGVRPL